MLRAQAFVLAVMLAIGQEQGQRPPLETAPIDPWEAHSRDLERQVVELRSQLLASRIDLSSCKATVDSVVFSGDAEKLVQEYIRIYGGEWAWSKEQNRPVRKEQREKLQ